MVYLQRFLIGREVQTIATQAHVSVDSIVSVEWHRTADHNGYKAYTVSVEGKDILIWLDPGGLAGILVHPVRIIEANRDIGDFTNTTHPPTHRQ